MENKTLNQLLKECIELSMREWDSLMESLWGKSLTKNLLKVLQEKVLLQGQKVKAFLYNDKEYWFDKNTRASLLALASCSEEPITLVLGDELVEVDADKVKKFISDLEVYASKCYVNTAKHLNSIKDLKTVEDVINYNYTSGYPNRLYLTLDLI